MGRLCPLLGIEVECPRPRSFAFAKQNGGGLSEASVSSDIAACLHWPIEQATGTSYTEKAVCSPPEACGDKLSRFYTDCIIIVGQAPVPAVITLWPVGVQIERRLLCSPSSC